MNHRFVAYDYMNVPRVWGEGETRDIAESRCRDELMDYARRRPDLWRKGFDVKESGDE